jgi:2-polyprenyl-3-methyl-5-hydroxy-6-metoxy-1,4-benzoquinol methylase
MIYIQECPVCGHKGGFTLHHICKDYTTSGEQFNLEKCPACRFVFTNPRPADADLGKYYQSEAYISHTDSAKGFINNLYHLARRYTLKSKVSLVNRLVKGKGALLDVGCGTGYFLEAASKDGWKVSGVEPDESTREQATKRAGEKVHPESELNTWPAESFDAITLWHVLEHVGELEKRMLQLSNLLKQEGVVLIAVPNPDSFDAAIYQEHWAAYDVPRHLWHFRPANLQQLASRNRLKVVAIRPMYLDAFYIALLSEKYKKSSLGVIKAFWVGLRAFFATIANKEKASSLIYILKHDTHE